MEKNDEISEGHYSTHYRMLDSRIGRWMSVDPAAAMYYSWSPYNLSADNPLLNSDPSGATVVIPVNDPNDWNGRNAKLATATSELIQDSPTFAFMYNTLNQMNSSLVMEMAITRQQKNQLSNKFGGHFNNDSKKPGILLGSLDKGHIVEEVAHAYQAYMHGFFAEAESVQLRSQLLAETDPAKKNIIKEQMLEIQKSPMGRASIAWRTTLDKNGIFVGEHSFLEVEAKLIRRFVYQEVKNSSNPMRNWWGPDLINSEQQTGTGPSIFDNFINTNFTNGQFKNITTPSEIRSFFGLQLDFQNSWKGSGAASYQKGAMEIEPDTYNSLPK